MRGIKHREYVRVLEGMLHESESESEGGDTFEQIFESFNNPIGYAKSVYMSQVTSWSHIHVICPVQPQSRSRLPLRSDPRST
jgi:hypothetical protein